MPNPIRRYLSKLKKVRKLFKLLKKVFVAPFKWIRSRLITDLPEEKCVHKATPDTCRICPPESKILGVRKENPLFFAWLVAIGGPEAHLGQYFAIHGPKDKSWTIGAGQDCDILLDSDNGFHELEATISFDQDRKLFQLTNNNKAKGHEIYLNNSSSPMATNETLLMNDGYYIDFAHKMQFIFKTHYEAVVRSLDTRTDD